MNELTTTTELQKITTGLESFEQRKQLLTTLAESARGIKIKGVDDKEGYKSARKKRIELRDAEILVEKEAKAMRDVLTPVSRHISAKEKELLKITEEEKCRLIKEESWYEDENEKIVAQKEAEEKAAIQRRFDLLNQYGAPVDYLSLMTMSDEVFEKNLAEAKAAFEAEQKRVADEKAELKRLQDAENDRLRVQAAEQEAERKRLKAIADEQAKKEAELLAAQKKIDDENARIEREKQAVIDAKKRAEELEQARKDAAAKALKDAEEKRIRDEKEKQEADRIAAEKEAKRVARMPDKKKAEALIKSLQITSYDPTLTFKSKDVDDLVIDYIGDADNLINNYLQRLAVL